MKKEEIKQPRKSDNPHNTDKTDVTDKTEKLIEFFKTIKQKESRPEKYGPENHKPDLSDYSAWNQTEEMYQKEQAEWLEKVKQKLVYFGYVFVKEKKNGKTSIAFC